MTSPARSDGTEPSDQIWLTRYLRLQKRYDVKVNERLAAAMRDIERDLDGLENGGIGAVVRDIQLRQAMTSISGTLSAFWNAIGDIIQAGQQDAATEALRTSFDWEEVLLRLNITSAKRKAMRASLISAGSFNVEAMLARIYRTRLPLSQQVYKTAALTEGWVESRIDKALAKGATVAELAREVRDFINPKTPGGATYAARRLARTEINAAYHAVTIDHFTDSPWVVGMQWRLSGSHGPLDVCDSMARNNHSGLGKGVFPRDAVPPKPHPQCLCTVYPKMMDPGRFSNTFARGDFDNYISATYGS